jgi:hypothetical protein
MVFIHWKMNAIASDKSPFRSMTANTMISEVPVVK